MVCTPVASEKLACIFFSLALVLTSYYALASAHRASRGKIGLDYGLKGDNLPTPEHTVALLRSRGIRRVRIYEARPNVIRAFADSGIDLMIGVPNEEVPKVAANLGKAFNWVTKHVLPFPTSGISYIIVGNEWLSNSSNDPSLLVPAMQNIYNALSTLQLWLSGIKVSTSHSMDLLSISFPPSKATFAERNVAVMRPLVDFLDNTGSVFMVNIFPYFAYLADEGVGLKFALFESTEPPVMDNNTGLNYTNLFDLQLDAVYAAITSLLSSSSSPSSSSCACNGSEVVKASNERVHSEAANRKSPVAAKKKGKVEVVETGWASGAGGSGTPPHKHLISTTSSLTSSATSTSIANVSRSSSAYISNIQRKCCSLGAKYATKAEEVEMARCECEAATVENARTYNQNLIRHVLQAKGTPAHPNTPIRAYIFALFNENLKPPGSEQHFGLFYPNGTAVYPINFHDRRKLKHDK